MSSHQAAKIFDSADNIYLCLDSDSPGINATRKNTKKMLPYITNRKVLKFMQLPKDLDADELILEYGT